MLKTGAIYTLVDVPAPTQSSSTSQEKKLLTVSYYQINVQSLKISNHMVQDVLNELKYIKKELNQVKEKQQETTKSVSDLTRSINDLRKSIGKTHSQVFDVEKTSYGVRSPLFSSSIQFNITIPGYSWLQNGNTFCNLSKSGGTRRQHKGTV